MLTIIQGDALASLKTLPDESIQCCVTSPPYWGLRDYGVEGQFHPICAVTERVRELEAKVVKLLAMLPEKEWRRI